MLDRHAQPKKGKIRMRLDRKRHPGGATVISGTVKSNGIMAIFANKA